MAVRRPLILAACLIAIVPGGLALGHLAHRPAVAVAHYDPSAAMSPFELFRGQRILFDGKVNGREAAMMLDSGAGMTVVDRAFAAAIGLKASRSTAVEGSGGSEQGEIASGVTVETGGLRLTGVDVLILDLSSVERAIGRKIPVVLGRDAFQAGIVAIDFPNQRIGFSNRTGFTPPAGATRIPLGERDGLPSLRVSLAGLEPIEADLDIGNGGSLAVARSYWMDQPRLAGLRHAQTQTGGVGGMVLARRVTLPQVELGGLRFAGVPAVLNEDSRALPDQGANVGIEMLKPFLVTVDAAGGALYLQGSPARSSFGRERAGARFELAGDRLRVAYVSPDGPAATAGLKAGDEIVAVDGRRVDSSYYRQPEWARGAAGTKVEFRRPDGSTVSFALADYY